MVAPALYFLAEQYATISATAEVAALRATKELPKGVIHVISDILVTPIRVFTTLMDDSQYRPPSLCITSLAINLPTRASSSGTT